MKGVIVGTSTAYTKEDVQPIFPRPHQPKEWILQSESSHSCTVV